MHAGALSGNSEQLRKRRQEYEQREAASLARRLAQDEARRLEEERKVKDEEERAKDRQARLSACLEPAGKGFIRCSS